MNILIIGGSGTISREVTKSLSLASYDVTCITRGINPLLPKGVNSFNCDIEDKSKMEHFLENKYYDCIINFINYDKSSIIRDIQYFDQKCSQYIFISSASCYEKPVKNLPITEKTPLNNPYWDYSQKKIEAEEALKNSSLPYTIVRPSHTYNNDKIPFIFNAPKSRYFILDRIKKELPVIIPGDGLTFWTLTHSKDFAKGFISLVNNRKALYEDFTITSDFYYTFTDILNQFASFYGVSPNPVYISTHSLLEAFPSFRGPLLGDKSQNAIFDNSKLRSINPSFKAKISFEEGLKDVVNYFEENPNLQKIEDIDFVNRYEGLLKIHNDYLAKLKKLGK